MKHSWKILEVCWKSNKQISWNSAPSCNKLLDIHPSERQYKFNFTIPLRQATTCTMQIYSSFNGRRDHKNRCKQEFLQTIYIKLPITIIIYKSVGNKSPSLFLPLVGELVTRKLRQTLRYALRSRFEPIDAL